MAKELNIPLHIHVAETKEESGIILKRYGKRPLAFLEELGYLDNPSVFAHGVELNEREIERLATSQVAIAHNPISNLKLASGIAPIIQLQKAGVVVGIATDSVASNNNLDMFEEGRTAATTTENEERRCQSISYRNSSQGADNSKGLRFLEWKNRLEVWKLASKQISCYSTTRENPSPTSRKYALSPGLCSQIQ